MGRRESVSFLCVGLASDILSVGAVAGAEDPVVKHNPVVMTGTGARKAVEEEERDSDVADGLSDSSNNDSSSLSPTIRVLSFGPEVVSFVSCIPVAYFLVNSMALYLNNSRFSLNSVATSTNKGSSGFGCASSSCNEISMVVILMDGSQVPFGGPFRMSRQMSPCSSMLGWYTRVRNWHLGGSNGYLSGMWMSILKEPP